MEHYGNELYHFMLKRKKHKYIARIEKPNKKARYFYTRKEYESYLKSKNIDINTPMFNKFLDQLSFSGSNKKSNVDKKKYEPFDFEEIEKVVEKYLSKTLKKKEETKRLSKQLNENLDKIMSAYADSFSKTDPDKDKYDNAYSDEECIKNIKEGLETYSKEYGEDPDYWKEGFIREYNEKAETENKKEIDKKYLDTDNGIIDCVSYIYDRKENEPLSLFCERIGLLDELQDDMHPKSFDDLNKIEDKTIDNITAANDSRYDYYKQKDLNEDGIIDDNDKKIQDSSDFNYGYSHNCAYCSVAYEMRERGYDVEASFVTQYRTHNNEQEIESWYKDASFIQEKEMGVSADDVEKHILEMQEDGTRGTMNLQCLFSGHSVAYVVENGKVFIIDAQIGKKTPIQYYNWFSGSDSRYLNVSYMRTDNLEFTDKALVCVKNRKR